MANKIRLIPQRDMSKHLAMEPKVQQTLRAASLRILMRAEALLAMHRDTGSHQIEYERIKSEKFGHIDHYVSMTGPAPVSVEFGHVTENGEWVRGLYIITRAAFGGL
jgi:hypothetical protein